MSRFHGDTNIYVSQIALRVTDLFRSIKFYEDIIGLKVLSKDERSAAMTVDGINPIVILTQPEDLISKLPRRTGLYHFAILLPDDHSLGLFLKNIVEKKYPLTGGSNHGVSHAIYLEDPDDNGIEIYADTEESTWNRSADSINMVTERLDYEKLLSIAGDDKWDGMPSDTIIGHIHLHVADLESAFKFYNLLGFELTQKMLNSAYFISTGGYHHHIGLNIWNGRGAEPLPGNSAGMEYYSLRFEDKDARQSAVMDLKDAGYYVMEAGEDIFTKDPSDNLIKLVIK